MKYLVPAFFFALTLVTLSFKVNATEVSTDEQTIRALEQTWLRATTTADKETLKQILDDQYVERAPDGRIRIKADVIGAPPPPAASMQDLQILRVELHGDTAIVLGTNHYRSTPSSTAVNYMCIDVFQRRDGAWRVIASQISRQPPG